MADIVKDGISYRLYKGRKEAVVLGFHRPEDYSRWGKLQNLMPFDVSIPSEIEQYGIKYSVVEIKKEAFQHKKIGKVTVPSSLRKVGNYAFAQSSISSFNRLCADNPIQIDVGEMAVSHCDELIHVAFNGLVKFEEDTFMGCSKLRLIDSENFINLHEAILANTKVDKIFISDSLLEVSKKWNQSSKIKDIYFTSVPSMEILLGLLAENQECILHCDEDSPIINLAFEGYRVMIEERT